MLKAIWNMILIIVAVCICALVGVVVIYAAAFLVIAAIGLIGMGLVASIFKGLSRR